LSTAEQTEIFSTQFLDRKYDFPPCSRFNSWGGCNANDIQTMVALEIGMGMCKKSSLEEYFSESHWLNNKPYYILIVSQEKYFLLQSSLHFNNNEEQISRGNPEYDPFFKMRPILEIVLNIAKWGVKVWFVCDRLGFQCLHRKM
jgi:hypothetical protein